MINQETYSEIRGVLIRKARSSVVGCRAWRGQDDFSNFGEGNARRYMAEYLADAARLRRLIMLLDAEFNAPAVLKVSDPDGAVTADQIESLKARLADDSASWHDEQQSLIEEIQTQHADLAEQLLHIDSLHAAVKNMLELYHSDVTNIGKAVDLKNAVSLVSQLVEQWEDDQCPF